MPSSRLTHILRQPEGSYETRAVMQAALLQDLRCSAIPVHKLGDHRLALRSGEAMPVGSVEYVRAALAAAGIEEPENLSYPDCARQLLRRHVRQVPAGQVLGTWFVKPVKTKLFSGFVFDSLTDPATLPDYEREQCEAFLALDAAEPVWISEPVRFVSEWRYYISEGQLVGCARYDEGADEAPSPDMGVVNELVACLQRERVTAGLGRLSVALDVGVLSSGETALVEVNDLWAIGLYRGAMDPKTYLHVLAQRWSQLVEEAPLLEKA